MMNFFNLSITTRLSAVKNIIALALLATIASTWPLWSADRYYPVFPGSDFFSSVNLIIAYAVPSLLIICLGMIFLFRKPRFFIGLSVLLCITLLVLDAGRSYYWFYFYLMFLLLLAGYNWRVDNANHFASFYNAIKIMLAGVYVLAAVQHFQYDFVHTQWPQFIKPFERFWTPEQCSYLQKAAYVIPFIELFIAVGLFFNGSKLTAIGFAVLFHLFSFVVLLLQKPQPEAAVLLWHVSMILLISVIFIGKTNEQKNHSLSFNFYSAFTLLVFGGAVPVWFILLDKPLKNKIDFMQNNSTEQYIYISEDGKKKLPLYVQSFTGVQENNYCKLSVTRWVLHETNTKQILGQNHLLQLGISLNKSYGTDALVALPVEDKLKAIAAK